MMLGKLPPKPHPAALPLMQLVGQMPQLPDAVDWTGKLQGNPVFCNDTLGCCTIASQAHIIRVWTSRLWGVELDIPDDLVRETYFKLTGGPDIGLAETDALAYWASQGFALPDRQYQSLLTGWCTLDHQNGAHIRASIAWFGAAYLGLGMPLAAQNANAWDCVPNGDSNTQPNSWGGHAVPAVAYDANGVTVISWGHLYKVSWPFLVAYLDEAHAPVSRMWLDTCGYAPSGFDLVGLENAMSTIAT